MVIKDERTGPNEGPTYPAGLEGPDLSGRVRERSLRTIAAYRRRYTWLRQRTERQLGRRASLCDIARLVRSLTATLRPSSFRQYRAALMQAVRDLYDAGHLTEAQARGIGDLAQAERVDGRKAHLPRRHGPARAGSRRAKGLSQKHRNALLNALEKPRTASQRQLALLCYLGPRLGLRPSEWPSLRLNGGNVVVRCAKYSVVNGRGISVDRRIDLADDLKAFCSHPSVQRTIQQIANDAERHGVDRWVAQLARELRRVRPVGSRIVLRSLRHQAKSNLARSGASREEIAAFMGHASADTQQAYGSRRGGWKHVPVCKPDPELVRLVRAGASMQSKLENSQPTTWAEAMSVRTIFSAVQDGSRVQSPPPASPRQNASLRVVNNSPVSSGA